MVTQLLPLQYENIVSLLVHQVRATTPQILSELNFLPPCDWDSFSRRKVIRELVSARVLMVHPELELNGPLLRWTPAKRLPDFGQLSYRAQSRWSKPPARRVVLTATEKAKRLYGGVLCGRKIRSRELDHDIALSAVFVHYANNRPDLASRWVIEDVLVAEGIHTDGSKVPDAVIRGTPEVIVEFAGSYSAKKLKEIHSAFSHQPYDLW